MKRLLVGTLLAMLLISSAAAQTGTLWLGMWANTDIVECGVSAPESATVGETFSVTAWMTVHNSGIAGAGWDTDTIGSVFAQVQSKATLTLSRDEGWGEADTVSAVGKQFAAQGQTGYQVSVITRLDGTMTVRVTYTGLATKTNARGTVSGLSEIQALALASWARGMAWGKAWDVESFLLDWFVKSLKPVSYRTSEPCAEHVVFHGLPKDTWWANLWRVELDGTLVEVPALQPTGQIVPAPWVPDNIHADLMVHGLLGCDYVIEPHRQDGYAYPAYRFTVQHSGSTATTEVWYDYQYLDKSS